MYDIYKDLVLYREQKTELAKETEVKVQAAYLNQIRQEFQSNEKIKDILIETEPAIAAKNLLLIELKSIVRDGSSDLFERALEQVLMELEKQRSQNPSQYLVNQSTGELVIPLNEGMIYQPPDFINENGKIQKAQPIVHPKITSTLALKSAEKYKIEKVTDKHKNNIVAIQALEHLKNPNQIVERAKEKLKELGLKECETTEGEQHLIKFGHESMNDVFQSFNPSFQRVCLFSEVLALKVKKLCPENGIYSISKLIVKDNQKTKWYEVNVVIKQTAKLTS